MIRSRHADGRPDRGNPDELRPPRVCEFCRLYTGGHTPGCITQLAEMVGDHG